MATKETSSTQLQSADRLEGSRRDLFRGFSPGKGAVVAGAAGMALASHALAKSRPVGLAPAFLVTVDLRGGPDGLSVLCPYDDPGYTASGVRNQTRLFPPGGGVLGGADEVIPIAGTMPILNSTSHQSFGLPQALAPLVPLYNAGELAFVHATGNLSGGQSHFASINAMGYGIEGPGAPYPDTGWITRHLASKIDHFTGAVPKFRALVHSPIPTPSTLGAPSSIPVVNPGSFSLPGLPQLAGPKSATVASTYGLYSNPTDPLNPMYVAHQVADEAITTLDGVTFSTFPPPAPSKFAMDMTHAADLAKNTGLEVYSVNLGGWDTHTNQGVYGGVMEGRMQELAEGLVAFSNAMSSSTREWIVVAVGEFGRTREENANGGTDHGRGGVAMIMSNILNGTGPGGGKLFGTWPGLGASAANPGAKYLAVQTDIRDIFYEIASSALHNPDPLSLFDFDSYSYTPPTSALGFL